MAELKLDLGKALRLVNKTDASISTRVVGALAAATLLVRNGVDCPSAEMLLVIDEMINALEDAITEVWETAK